MTKRSLPPSASVTHPTDGDRQVMPAADRNGQPIEDLVARTIGGNDIRTALEIASGTGQHILRHALRHPQITWQPSDVDAGRLASINAYATEAANIRPALMLDATRPGWSADLPPQDLILLVNLTHLISEPEVRTLIAEVGQALRPGGIFMLYGPFMRGGELTSEGDARFHAELRAADPEIGYKDDFDLADWIMEADMTLADMVDMPANNLAFIAQRN